MCDVPTVSDEHPTMFPMASMKDILAQAQAQVAALKAAQARRDEAAAVTLRARVALKACKEEEQRKEEQQKAAATLLQSSQRGRATRVQLARQAQRICAECVIDSDTGATALHAATKARHAACMRALLEDAKCDVNEADEDGTTCLHVAAQSGSATAVQQLLGAGAAIDARDVDSETALTLACQEGHAAAVEALLGARANPLLANDSGSTALVEARLSGDLRCMRLLEEAVEAWELNGWGGGGGEESEGEDAEREEDGEEEEDGGDEEDDEEEEAWRKARRDYDDNDDDDDDKECVDDVGYEEEDDDERCFTSAAAIARRASERELASELQMAQARRKAEYRAATFISAAARGSAARYSLRSLRWLPTCSGSASVMALPIEPPTPTTLPNELTEPGSRPQLRVGVQAPVRYLPNLMARRHMVRKDNTG